MIAHQCRGHRFFLGQLLCQTSGDLPGVAQCRRQRRDLARLLVDGKGQMRPVGVRQVSVGQGKARVFQQGLQRRAANSTVVLRLFGADHLDRGQPLKRASRLKTLQDRRFAARRIDDQRDSAGIGRNAVQQACRRQQRHWHKRSLPQPRQQVGQAVGICQTAVPHHVEHPQQPLAIAIRYGSLDHLNLRMCCGQTRQHGGIGRVRLDQNHLTRPGLQPPRHRSPGAGADVQDRVKAQVSHHRSLWPSLATQCCDLSNHTETGHGNCGNP